MALTNYRLNDLVYRNRNFVNINEGNIIQIVNENFNPEQQNSNHCKVIINRINALKSKKINLDLKYLYDDYSLRNLLEIIRNCKSIKGLTIKRISIQTIEEMTLFYYSIISLMQNECEKLEFKEFYVQPTKIQVFEMFSEMLCILHGLKILTLSDFNLSFIKISNFGSKNLIELNLTKCKINCNVCFQLKTIISKNPLLKKLNLSRNLIGNVGFERILYGIIEGELKFLEDINLKFNSINEPALFNTYMTLPNIKVLKNFNISNNLLEEYSMLLFTNFPKIKVKNLVITDIKIGYFAFHVLSKNLYKFPDFKYLRKLDISNNNLSEKQVKTIFLSLSNNKSIENLKLLNINYDIYIDKALSNLIITNSSLKEIWIGKSDRVQRFIPDISMCFKSKIPNALRLNHTLINFKLYGAIINSINMLNFCQDLCLNHVFRLIDLSHSFYYGDLELSKLKYLTDKTTSNIGRKQGRISLPAYHPQIMRRQRFQLMADMIFIQEHLNNFHGQDVIILDIMEVNDDFDL